METLSSKGFKSIAWEESEHDMNCPGGSYRCGRKTQLSQSPCEGRLIEGIPLLYQGLIPSTLCCIQETMKGQLKYTLETSVYSFEEDGQGRNSLPLGHLDGMGQLQDVCQPVFTYPDWGTLDV